MENGKAKKVGFSKADRRKAVRLGALVLIAALVLALCISIGMRSHIQSEYTSAREQTGEQLYTQMYMFCQTFDQITVPGADIQEDIIPKMEDYYLVAKTLNDVLKDSYGQRYEVLTEENLTALDAAFEEFDAAFSMGKSTDDAQAAMQTAVAQMRTLLDTRFSDGILKAK